MYQPYTTQKKSISPTIALVRHVSNEKHITMDFPNGVALNAIYINHFSHEVIREDQLRFKGPITIHLMASDIQNCYYLAWWSEKQSQHVCSCYEFRRSETHCHHTDMINHQEDEVAVSAATALPPVKDEIDVNRKLTVEDWREIQKRDKERQRKEWGMYWREAKQLQLETQQLPRI